MPISPTSFTSTAVSASAGSLSNRLSSVVFPAPRKPVKTLSGMGSTGPAGFAGVLLTI
jgi:hypothetical protein